MNIKQLNEELQKLINKSKISEEIDTFIAFDNRMDWAYGKIKKLDYDYQHSRIDKREYIDSAINMANKIIESANIAKEDLHYGG